MKVVCVWSFTNVDKDPEVKAFPAVGDEDEVVSSEVVGRRTFYELKRFGHDPLFRADHFATLPDQSADEMQEAEREAIVNLETA